MKSFQFSGCELHYPRSHDSSHKKIHKTQILNLPSNQ